NKQIAEKLAISDITVRHHLTSIFNKLNLSDRFELIIYSYSQGLCKLPESGRKGQDGLPIIAVRACLLLSTFACFF
ncbi:MAG TPA: LuxR C-terminal-related transcriptional regulator, partial [Blastocatellia bacterium]